MHFKLLVHLSYKWSLAGLCVIVTDLYILSSGSLKWSALNSLKWISFETYWVPGAALGEGEIHLQHYAY